MPHSTHCCVHHGCKYGNDDCPVVKGEVEMVYNTCGVGFDLDEPCKDYLSVYKNRILEINKVTSKLLNNKNTNVMETINYIRKLVDSI